MVRSFPRNGNKHYGTSSLWERYNHARCQSCNTTIASFARVAEPGTGHKPEVGGEVAQSGESGGLKDRAEGAAFDRSHKGRGGNDRRSKRWLHAPSSYIPARCVKSRTLRRDWPHHPRFRLLTLPPSLPSPCVLNPTTGRVTTLPSSGNGSVAWGMALAATKCS